MKIFAISKNQPGATPEQLRPHFVAESKAAWDLYASGAIREIYLRTDRPGAVIVLEADSVEAARQTLATLPLMQAGLIDFDYLPVGPFSSFALFFAQ